MLRDRQETCKSKTDVSVRLNALFRKSYSVHARLRTARKLGRGVKDNDRLPRVLIASTHVFVKTVF